MACWRCVSRSSSSTQRCSSNPFTPGSSRLWWWSIVRVFIACAHAARCSTFTGCYAQGLGYSRELSRVVAHLGVVAALGGACTQEDFTPPPPHSPAPPACSPRRVHDSVGSPANTRACARQGSCYGPLHIGGVHISLVLCVAAHLQASGLRQQCGVGHARSSSPSGRRQRSLLCHGVQACCPGCRHPFSLLLGCCPHDTGAGWCWSQPVVALGAASCTRQRHAASVDLWCVCAHCICPFLGQHTCGDRSGGYVAEALALGLLLCTQAAGTYFIHVWPLAVVTRAVARSFHTGNVPGQGVAAPLLCSSQQSAAAVFGGPPWVLFGVVPSTWHWWKFTSGCCRMQQVVWLGNPLSLFRLDRCCLCWVP